MRTKFVLTNILLALALPLAPTGARADSATGATNIIIGSTPVSGTAGLLFSDGAYVQSLPGTYTIGSGYIGNTFTLSNGSYLELQSDGSKSTAPLTGNYPPPFFGAQIGLRRPISGPPCQGVQSLNPCMHGSH